MLDDDKRQLRLYQERYLIDGDLHSDSPGRTRRFRWKNIGAFLTRVNRWGERLEKDCVCVRSGAQSFRSR